MQGFSYIVRASTVCPVNAEAGSLDMTAAIGCKIGSNKESRFTPEPTTWPGLPITR